MANNSKAEQNPAEAAERSIFKTRSLLLLHRSSPVNPDLKRVPEALHTGTGFSSSNVSPLLWTPSLPGRAEPRGSVRPVPVTVPWGRPRPRLRICFLYLQTSQPHLDLGALCNSALCSHESSFVETSAEMRQGSTHHIDSFFRLLQTKRPPTLTGGTLTPIRRGLWEATQSWCCDGLVL